MDGPIKSGHDSRVCFKRKGFFHILIRGNDAYVDLAPPALERGIAGFDPLGEPPGVFEKGRGEGRRNACDAGYARFRSRPERIDEPAAFGFDLAEFAKHGEVCALLDRSQDSLAGGCETG